MTVTEERTEIPLELPESSATTWWITSLAAAEDDDGFVQINEIRLRWPDAQNSNSRSRSYRSTLSRTRQRPQSWIRDPARLEQLSEHARLGEPGNVEPVDQNLVLLRDEEVTARQPEHPVSVNTRAASLRTVSSVAVSTRAGTMRSIPPSEYFASWSYQSA